VIPLFSILHATIRTPTGWLTAFTDWMDKADDPTRIEYILCVETESKVPAFKDVRIVFNEGLKTPVDAFNTAARFARGRIFVIAADDWLPVDHWDTQILSAVGDLERECVVWIESEHPHIITHPVLTRKYYERPGRGGCGGALFHPSYSAMGADDDFTAVALRDGVVVRPGIRFEHRHWTLGLAELDSAYSHSNELSGDKDERIARRRAGGFQ
jgi:hypothetical protein